MPRQSTLTPEEKREHSRLRQQRWRERHPDKSRAKSRAFKTANKEKCAAYAAEYYVRERAAITTRMKAYSAVRYHEFKQFLVQERARLGNKCVH